MSNLNLYVILFPLVVALGRFLFRHDTAVINGQWGAKGQFHYGDILPVDSRNPAAI